jgi:hypothetical protein
MIAHGQGRWSRSSGHPVVRFERRTRVGGPRCGTLQVVETGTCLKRDLSRFGRVKKESDDGAHLYLRGV